MQISGTIPSTVDWAITTGPAPFNGTTVASGTAASLTSSDIGNGFYQNYFSIPPLGLEAGTTYWLQLSNGRGFASEDGQLYSYCLYWDANDGPSVAYSGYSDTNGTTITPLLANGNSHSEAFQILGTPTPTPIPSTVFLLGAGLLRLGIYRRRKLAS